MTNLVDPPLGQILASERGFDGAWIHVRVDKVQLPSGRIATREVVEHPGAVAIVAITRAGDVLMLPKDRTNAEKLPIVQRRSNCAE